MGKKRNRWIPVSDDRYWMHIATGAVWWERYIVPDRNGERVQLGLVGSRGHTCVVRRDDLGAPYWIRTARPRRFLPNI